MVWLIIAFFNNFVWYSVPTFLTRSWTRLIATFSFFNATYKSVTSKPFWWARSIKFNCAFPWPAKVISTWILCPVSKAAWSYFISSRIALKLSRSLCQSPPIFCRISSAFNRLEWVNNSGLARYKVLLPAPFIPATMMYLFGSLMLNHEMLVIDNLLLAFI